MNGPLGNLQAVSEWLTITDGISFKSAGASAGCRAVNACITQRPQTIKDTKALCLFQPDESALKGSPMRLETTE
eukprot:1159507-Pelagomonas_calceolata.AAC.5